MEKFGQSSQRVIQPAIAVERQVTFIQAVLVLVGIILGNSFSQWFYMLDIIVGIGLLVTSLTGECLLHKLLAKLPWNKPFIKVD